MFPLLTHFFYIIFYQKDLSFSIILLGNILYSLLLRLFLSNGPGDPTMCKKTIDGLRTLVNDPKFDKPVFGICLGNQLLGLAAGTFISML